MRGSLIDTLFKKLFVRSKQTLEYDNFYIDGHLCTTGELGNRAFFRPKYSGEINAKKISEYAFSVKNDLSKIDFSLEIDTFGRIQRITNDLVISRKMPYDGYKKTKVVFGVDALNLASMDIARNGVLQVASQFNFLESPSNEYTPISLYYSDRTQGPMASLSAPLSLVMRDNTLSENDPGFFGENFQYKNGYYEPSNDRKKLFEEYCFINNHINNLPILIQDGYDITGKNLVTQVFCAAPSYQGREKPDEATVDALICNSLISAQYEAIARVAVWKSYITKAEVSLHLTLVGQGAFNNNESAILQGIMKAIAIVADHNVKIYIHVYDKNQLNNLPMEITILSQLNR